VLGHDKLGRGDRVVIVLNDWLGDTSIWDSARTYLDPERFTWVFADLRGYGRSRGQSGDFTIVEAARDVLELAEALGQERFAIVGHSMSSLVAVHLAQQQSRRIERVVALTPPPPMGMGVDPDTMASLRHLGTADDRTRMHALAVMQGDRLSNRWIQFLVDRWRDADPEAVAGYVPVFARDGLPDRERPVSMEVLMVTGEQDGEPMRREAVQQLYAHLCPRLVVMPLADSGHYPMREVPPLLVATIERWLADATPEPPE
jgi:3-oxoadipate enol-lactonase